MLHQIGAGTLGPVFRAYDSTRERLVAVKLFTLDLPPERGHQLVAAFERLIAADLRHPSLAAPLATGISDVSAFLVQDYVAADSLDLAIREHGPAPAANALRVVDQLAGALDVAAAVGITHGALHPRDVLVSSDDTQMTGLGVTQALARIGVVAPVRRPYTAPERLAGGEWDRRADVFGLAALMHELMWGRRVSGLGAQAAESLTEIAGADLSALRATFARALAEHPAERYETALEFAAAVRRACPDVAMVPGPAPAPKRRAVRKDAPRLPLDDEVDVMRVAEPVEGGVVQAFRPAEPAADLKVRTTPETRVPDALEDERYRDVEVAPAIVALDEPPMAIPAGLMTGHDPERLSAFERSRSAIWPLVLALVVGIAIGFAAGYGVGWRDQPGTPAVTAVVPPAAPAQAGREFTEVAAPAAPPKLEVTSEKSEVGNQKPDVSNLKSEIRTLKSQAGLGRLPVRPRRRAARSRAAGTPIQAGRLAGALAVASRPAGAKVYMDGKLVGTTPMLLASVPAGSHAIRIEHDGYRRWSSSVRVVASEQNRVTASLER